MILRIPPRGIARNDVNMGMIDSLPRSLAKICADVYPLRLKLILDQVLHLPNEFEEIDVFLRGQFPDRGNVAFLELPENARWKRESRRRMRVTAWSRPKLRDQSGRRCNPSTVCLTRVVSAPAALSELSCLLLQPNRLR
jgi:hypothetical protein